MMMKQSFDYSASQKLVCLSGWGNPTYSMAQNENPQRVEDLAALRLLCASLSDFDGVDRLG